MSAAPPPPAPPGRIAIASHAELRVAVLGLLAQARREVCAAHRTLALLGLGELQFVEALRTLLARGPRAQVRLLADEGNWLEREAPRLRALQRDYGHALHLRLSAEAEEIGDATVLIVDGRSYLQLAPTAYPRGVLALDAPAEARAVMQDFERRWEAAGSDLPSQPLGLG
ncbi:MAG: hypothetical protein RL669_1386 [Pseudomonadota bacterium]|jgi:hypothetical protein